MNNVKSVFRQRLEYEVRGGNVLYPRTFDKETAGYLVALHKEIDDLEALNKELVEAASKLLYNWDNEVEVANDYATLRRIVAKATESK